VARIRREAFNIEGQRVPRWTLQVVQVVDERLALAGAAVLDADRLDALLSSVTDGAYVALEDPEGATITATFDAGRPPSAADFDQQEQVVGGGPKGPQLGTLRLFFDRKPLERAVQKLWWTAGAAAALSALFALLVGLWTSRRLANPIERLVVAAGAIAAGARDERVPEVRGRDEVAKLTNAFNRMTHDLSESEDRLRHAERVAAWQEIARRIAHEIKNPLFPIQMSIETLQKVHERKHPDFEEVFEESTRTILEEVDRLGRIVGEFRDFARLPAPDMAPVDLSALLRSTVNLHRDVAPGVTVAWTGTDGCVVAADPDQMTAAATNLIKNAIEAHGDDPPPGARVTVDLRCSDGEVVSWTVEDNGPGMPEEVRAKLFTPYFTTKATGTGLGLAITHRIVVEHRGRIRVDSVVGRGTCFGVELPTRADE
jgi:nitrogen fixation/metabolism regulation signal transduction histidine kinase